jgi:RND family efflux transporter MFP subunit
MFQMKNFSLMLLLPAMLAWSACAEREEAVRREKIIPVKVTGLRPSTLTAGRSYVGTVEASAAVSLSFAGAGSVEQVFVTQGQRVRKGQLLATLHAATAENAYQMMLVKQQQAQDAYDRLAKVHEHGSLPDMKLVEVETGLQQARSMTAVARKNLDDCRLCAPRDGVIAARFVETGSSALPGVPAFRIVSVDRVKVRIAVPENEIGKITEGQKVGIVVPALNHAAFSGRVTMKGVVIDPVSHTCEVRIEPANGVAPPLLPGMVCKVSLADEAETAAWVVPNRTVQIASDGRKYVWLADGNTARRRFVETGGLDDNGIVIAEGLSAGDRLITEGFQKVSEGMKIMSQYDE